MASKTKAEGMYPGADPTAPGGMSKANLRLELREKHGVSMDDSREMSWPDLIQRVIDERLAREAEAKGTSAGRTQSEIEGDLLDTPPPFSGTAEDMFDLLDEDEADPLAEYEGLAEDVDVDEEDETDPWADAREQELRGKQVPELKGLARDYQIAGSSTMRRAELIAAVLQYEIDYFAEHPDGEGEDPVCRCGTEESAHASVDPPHLFVPGGYDDEPDEDYEIHSPRGGIQFAGSFDGITEQPDPLPEDFDEDDEVFDPETLFAEIVAERQAEADANPPIFLGIPGIKDYVFDGHAGAGPSASERWINCTMSLSASREFLETLSPNQQRTYAGANLAARQGTTAHAVSEAKANHMLGRIDDAELDNALLDLSIVPDEGEAYDDEMDEYTNEYVDLIRQYVDERGAERVLIERRVSAAIPLAELHEGEVYMVHGSADCIGLPTEDTPDLLVADLKYGEGIDVEVEDNTQAMTYALGALDLLTDDEGNLITDVETVTIVIAQPRLGGIKVWKTTLDELFDWRDDVLSPALTRALYGRDEGATYEPSKTACQFCPARGRCPALAEQRMHEAIELFDVVQDAEFENGPGAFPETESLDNERLGSLLDQISGLMDLYPDLKEEAQRRLHRGEEIPGRWLVNYSPPRKWKDGAVQKIENSATLASKLILTEPRLLSPAQAEKVLGDGYGRISKLVEKPDKRPVMNTGAGDRRSRWEGKPPEAMFPDIEDIEDDESAGVERAAEEMFPDGD